METAVSYLGLILNDLEQTKNNLAAYNNLILILSAKYGTIDNPNKLTKTMSDPERNAVIQTVGLFRTYATRTYIGFKSIKNKINPISQEQLDIIETNYSSIENEPIPKYETSKQFVQKMSDILVEEINIGAITNSAQKSESLAQSSAAPSIE